MTLLFGARCDDGVLIATDSLRLRVEYPQTYFNRPLGEFRVNPVLTDEKLSWHDDRLASAWCGDGLPLERPLARSAGSVEEIARATYAAVISRLPLISDRDPVFTAAGRPQSDDVQLLLAGGTLGSEPDVVLVQRRFELLTRRPVSPLEVVTVPRGKMLLAGAARGWGERVRLDRVVVPATVAETIPLAAAICYAFVEDLAAQLRGVRLVAFPLHVAVFTRQTWSKLSVPDLAPEVGANVIESLRALGLELEIARATRAPAADQGLARIPGCEMFAETARPPFSPAAGAFEEEDRDANTARR